MRRSLRALLEYIVDYAGLFPPARLSLDEAIHNYARYRTEPEHWMLGCFVCPVARLVELEPYHDLLAQGSPWFFAVLGRGGSTQAEFLEALRSDLNAVASFEERNCRSGRPGAIVASFETTFPLPVLRGHDPTSATRDLLRESWALLANEKPNTGMPLPCYELPLAPDWKTLAPRLLKLLGPQSTFDDPRLARFTRPKVLKVRCGGLEPSAFPLAGDLAFMIRCAGELDVPLKFTAGLHHPLRRFDAGVGTTIHGFLNVFGAGVLHSSRKLEEEQVRQILEDEDPSHLVFDDEGFRWQDQRATIEEIACARLGYVRTFGSCSFDEPRNDLRALGVLE